MVSVGSLFAGIGGIDLAFEAAGFDVRWQVEIDEFCRGVLAKHWPDTKRYNDIHKCHNLLYVDVITAGFPCQPFSVAGKQKGHNDERFLVPEMLRVIKEVKPRVILFENVPGFTSLNDGAEFKSLLRALAEMGYDAEWGHIRASDVGAPHRRERWFCVAYSNIQRHVKSDTATRQDIHYSNGKYPPKVRRRTSIRPAVRSRKTMAHANGTRFKRKRPPIQVGQNNQIATKRAGRIKTRRTIESRFRRGANGVSCRMDIIRRFPARLGEVPHEWEPPRVSGPSPSRAKRLKALGNAVVPAQVFPLAAAIREWLEK